ncbi:MAG: Crp/Fnr family transcriptional regulator [Acidobacteriota bacterium]|nr:Crp/Fnr family transcriptional regulator [Acidobacteriota bacterium]
MDNRILAALPADELRPLEPHMERVTLELATPLIVPNETIRWIYFPTTCLASLVTVLEDGSTVEAGSVGHEGVVGIPVVLGDESTPMQTLVQIAGEAIRIPAPVLREQLERGLVLRRILYRYIHALFIIASQSAACNRKHQVEARLARWLLMSADGIGSEHVAITHEFLAAMLGVRRPGVTDAALKLQELGLIQYRRASVEILDRPRLEDTACECYRLVADEYDRIFS